MARILVETWLAGIKQSKGYYSKYPVYAPIVDSGGQSLDARLFDVKSDSITDNTLSFKRAFAAMKDTGKPLFIPPGNYVCSTIYSAFMPQVYAYPGTVNILSTNMTDATWNFGVTSLGASIFLSSDALKGSTVITGINTTTLSVDDLVQFVTDATDNGTAYQQTIRIYSIDSATQMTLVDPLYTDFTVAQNGRVRKYPSNQSGGYVKGVRFKHIGGPTNTGGLLRIWNGANLDIDIVGEGAGAPGVELQNCYQFRVNHVATRYYDILVTGIPGQFGYGVNVSGSCANGQVNVIADQVRHAVAFNGTSNNVRVTGVAHGCTSTSWDAHQGGHNIVFEGCQAYGGRDFAFQLRGKRQHIHGGVADQCFGGVFVFDSPGENEIKGLHISNTRDSGDNNRGNGIVVSKTMTGLTIEGNDFYNIARSAISLRAGLITSPYIMNNRATNVGLSLVSNERNFIRQLSASSMIGGEVSGNILRDNQVVQTLQYGIQLAGTANASTLIRGNSFANFVDSNNAFNGAGIADSVLSNNYVNNVLVP